MIFAFAISVVAQQIADFFIVATNNWTSPAPSGKVFDLHFLKLVAAGTHLLLALLMISISWIMWSRSQAAGHRTDVQEIFSIKFATFIMEVLLVTLYFSLSKSVEGDFSSYSKDKTLESYLTPSSAKPEALQMFLIFCIFATWDLIVDIWKSPTNPLSQGAWKILDFLAGVITYCSASIICAIGAWLIYHITPENGTPQLAIAGDVALISLLFLFNQGKILEFHLFKVFPLQETRNNTKRTPTRKQYIIISFFLISYLLCTAAIKLPCFLK